MAFKTIPRESLRENGLPKKGIKTTKQVTNYLRKNLRNGYQLFTELQRLVGREKALSKVLSKARMKAKATRADRRTARNRIRVVLSEMLDLGLGCLNEVIVHCRAYHVAA